MARLNVCWVLMLSKSLLYHNHNVQKNFLFISVKIYLRAMKNEDTLNPKNRKRPFDSTKRNVYCLFKSKQSFNHFLSSMPLSNSLLKEPHLFHAQVSAIHSKQPTERTEYTIDAEVYKIGKFSKEFRCINCGRIQSASFEENNLCQECCYLQNLVNNGNLQKFVFFLYDFKTRKSQLNPQRRSRINRIESIESCQSLIVDKADQNKNNARHKRNNSKQSLNSINSMDIDRYVQKGNHLIESLSSNKYGYFCNECLIVPIIGRRFHCFSCEDFDLCEKCYFYVGHKHEVKSFDDKKLSQAKTVHLQILKRSQKLKNTLNFLSSSIRNFENKSKLYKTATSFRQVPIRQKEV